VAGWVSGGFGSKSFGEFRSIPTRANRQPAAACYLRKPGDSAYRPLSLDVLRIEEGLLAEVIAFPLEPLLEPLGLPPTL
jgi:RNA polymerase sigma-70 factor, ECF subfamily